MEKELVKVLQRKVLVYRLQLDKHCIRESEEKVPALSFDKIISSVQGDGDRRRNKNSQQKDKLLPPRDLLVQRLKNW